MPDTIAFEDHVRRHQGILFKVCNVYGPSEQDREDLAQDILIQLWRSFPSFDGRCAFSTWMYRVALNTAISWRRHDWRHRRHTEPLDRQSVNVPAREIGSENLQLLYRIIDQLDPVQKAMMLLYLDGNSYQEIAEVLGTTPSNIATRLNRLKSIWKRQVTEKPPPQPGE